jgi:hypothetical protein
MKLGELLISAGKITTAQLEETLRDQAIFGGKFGTNLVEMGYLDEHDLAHFLSKKSGFPHALPEQLMNISPHITRLIPEDTVRKHRVIPIALNNRKLSLAMTDPSDYAVIDEISFVTGYIVVPHITPELRLISALEKYYNVKRDQRYISVAGGGRNRATRTVLASAHLPGQQAIPIRPAPSAPPVQLASPSRPAPSVVDDSDILDLPLLDEFECFGDMDLAEAPAPTPVFPMPVLPTPALSTPPFPAPGILHRESEKEYGLEEVLQGLSRAKDRDDIADLIVGYAAQQFTRSALFLLKGNKATGWLAQIGKKPLPGFDRLEIPLDEPSVLKVVADSKAFYLGPLPISHCNSRIIAALGGGSPVNQLLVPLMMMGRVVAVLYVEGGTLRLDEQVADLQKLLGKGSMAFEILILKSKILLT